MEPTALDKDLVVGLVVVTVGPSATEVATPTREGRTGATAAAAEAAIPSAPRCQARPHRGPAIHAARRVDKAVVLPVRPASEDDVATVVATREPTVRRAIRRRIAATPTEAAATTGRLVRPVVDRAVPALAATRLDAPLGTPGVPFPTRHGARRPTPATSQTTS